MTWTPAVQKTDDETGSHIYSFGLQDTAHNGNLYTPGLAQRRGSTDRYFQTDWLGSTRYLTDQTGNGFAVGLRYDAYGAVSGTTGAGTPDSTAFQFAGAWG